MTSYNIYLATKPEKYALLDQLRAVGARCTGVSGCGTGYYIQLDATPAQADQINDFLEVSA